MLTLDGPRTGPDRTSLEVARPPHVLIDAEGNEVGYLVGRGEYLELMEVLAAHRHRLRLPAYWRRAVRCCLAVGDAVGVSRRYG
jgi:hypothetical protein